MVAEALLPVVAMPPGLLVNVHEPDGKPLNNTEPVAAVQVGCATVLTTGAGTTGCALMIALADAADVHPAAFVTVNVYVVPAVRPLIVADVVLPVVDILPGIRVKVHEPDGKPLTTTEPVDTVQVGCVIAPTVGFAGTAGAVLITTLLVAVDVQPAAFVTVNV
jgi:hypothetical protein